MNPNTDISRQVLSKAFGGNQQEYTGPWRIGRPGNTKFTALLPEWNPHVPLVAGAPGMLYRAPGATQSDEPQSTIIRVKKSTPTRWLYIGEYRYTLMEPMTVEEWRSLSRKVSFHGVDQRGLSSLVRRQVRNNRIEVLAAAEKDYVWGEAEQELYAGEHLKRMPEDERRPYVEDLLDRGVVVCLFTTLVIMGFLFSASQGMNIYGMQCIGYRKELQLAICRGPTEEDRDRVREEPLGFLP